MQGVGPGHSFVQAHTNRPNVPQAAAGAAFCTRTSEAAAARRRHCLPAHLRRAQPPPLPASALTASGEDDEGEVDGQDKQEGSVVQHHMGGQRGLVRCSDERAVRFRHERGTAAAAWTLPQRLQCPAAFHSMAYHSILTQCRGRHYCSKSLAIPEARQSCSNLEHPPCLKVSSLTSTPWCVPKVAAACGTGLPPSCGCSSAPFSADFRRSEWP